MTDTDPRRVVAALRREGTDPVRGGRPWSLPLGDRVLLVAAYWRTNLTLRRLAPLFGASKSAADRITANRVEHTFARMRSWKILRDCRLKGSGVHHAMLGTARLHNLALTG